MDWKTSSTPSELNDNDRIIRRSLDIANFINKNFVDKVRSLGNKLPIVSFSLSNCINIMTGKKL